jgi:hypothetical protein
MDEELREKQLSRLDLAGITMPEEDKRTSIFNEA